MIHVPYKGSAPMDTDLLGGQISMAFDVTPTAMPLALAGKVRALGAGMATRIPSMPSLPTLQEQGIKGYECRHLERDPRAGRHAEADRRQAQRGHKQGDG